MADMRIKFLATSVQMQMHLSVFLPDSVIADPACMAPDGLKTLWLLHGEGGDRSDWQRLSMVEHHAQAAGIALVMPNMDNSMYMDMAHGGYPYFRYLSQDLPAHARDLVRVLSARPQDNYVAGVGVGGYGALKWALRSPGSFAAAAAFSAPVDIVGALRAKAAAGALADDWAAAFGDAGRVEGTPDDILFLARQAVAANEATSRIRLALSRRDEGFAEHAAAARALSELGLSVDLHEEPDAAGWPFWSDRVGAFIDAIAAAREEG